MTPRPPVAPRRGCRIHGLRWFDEHRHCRICEQANQNRRYAAWRSMTLEQKCARLRERMRAMREAKGER